MLKLLLVLLSVVVTVLARPVDLVLPGEDIAVRSERSTNLSHITGTARKIQMYIKHRYLQILPDGSVNGTTEDASDYTILQRTSVRTGQLLVQGVATCLFLCMDSCGLLYGSREFSADCVFNETFEQHHYISYSSSKYSNERRTLYVALNRYGLPRKVQVRARGSLGKLSTYTMVQPLTVPQERVLDLAERILRARESVQQTAVASWGSLQQAQHPLRHHGYHQLCPALHPQRLQQQEAERNRHGAGTDETGRDRFRCRRRKKRKKKRRCEEDDEGCVGKRRNKKRRCKEGDEGCVPKKRCQEDDDNCVPRKPSKNQCPEGEDGCVPRKQKKQCPEGDDECASQKQNKKQCPEGDDECVSRKQNKNQCPEGDDECVSRKQNKNQCPEGDDECVSRKQNKKQCPEGEDDCVPRKQNKKCPEGDDECVSRKQNKKQCPEGDDECVSRKQNKKQCPEGEDDCVPRKQNKKQCPEGDNECLSRKQNKNQCQDGDDDCINRKNKNKRCQKGDDDCTTRRKSKKRCEEGKDSCVGKKQKKNKNKGKMTLVREDPAAKTTLTQVTVMSEETSTTASATEARTDQTK